VERDVGRCASAGCGGGGVVGREGKLASFCSVAAVSAKPGKAEVNRHPCNVVNKKCAEKHHNITSVVVRMHVTNVPTRLN